MHDIVITTMFCRQNISMFHGIQCFSYTWPMAACSMCHDWQWPCHGRTLIVAHLEHLVLFSVMSIIVLLHKHCSCSEVPTMVTSIARPSNRLEPLQYISLILHCYDLPGLKEVGICKKERLTINLLYLTYEHMVFGVSNFEFLLFWSHKIFAYFAS